MHGRVVIPIRNSTGELVGYAGRAVNEGWTQVQLPIRCWRRQHVAP